MPKDILKKYIKYRPIDGINLPIVAIFCWFSRAKLGNHSNKGVWRGVAMDIMVMYEDNDYS